MHDVLVDTLHASLVVVGENFRFGHKAAGDVDLLRRLGRTFGFGVEAAPLVAADDTVFSSTYIRSLIAAVTWARRPPRSDAPTAWKAWWCAATSAAGSSASPRRTS